MIDIHENLPKPFKVGVPIRCNTTEEWYNFTFHDYTSIRHTHPRRFASMEAAISGARRFCATTGGNYDLAREIAYEMFAKGLQPTWSILSNEVTLTSGYGVVDSEGWFQFPLRVNQETFEIIPKEEI